MGNGLATRRKHKEERSRNGGRRNPPPRRSSKALRDPTSKAGLQAPAWLDPGGGAAGLLKVHLGCGKNYLPGWINVDLFSTINADLYADLSALPFASDSVACLYASHVLEHCHRYTILATLAHWRQLLCVGGIVRIAVPDFAACCEWYRRTGDLPSITGLLFGGQNHPKNNHFIAFDKRTLTDALKRVGFRYVRPWDWRKTEHSQFDDYSQSFLPHMDKDNGTLMSLNVEAMK